MSLFKKLKGTMETVFHIGNPSASAIKTPFPGNGAMQIVKSDESTLEFLEVADHYGGSFNENEVATLADVQGYMPLIYAGFAGASPPGTPADNKFYFCHTSGGSYTAGRVYCKLASESALQEISTGYIGFLVTDSAITGTISLDADWLYAWNGSSWEKKVDFSGDGVGLQFIKVPITTTGASSTSQIPAGAVITQIIVDVTTAYSPAGTITVECNSVNILVNADVELDTINQYVIEDVSSVATADTVTVTIGGSPAVGAGTVYVGYVTPKT